MATLQIVAKSNAIKKIEKTIQSVKTQEHREACKKMITNFRNLYKDNTMADLLSDFLNEWSIK